MVNIFHSTVSRLGITPWLEYVGTEDNIADLPSRGEFGLLYTLGGPDSFRPAALPPGPSFTGLLAPLTVALASASRRLLALSQSLKRVGVAFSRVFG